MGLYHKFLCNARKPEGLLGRLRLAKMNTGHAPLADWGCRSLAGETPGAVLDIGCGGGANLERFLKEYPAARVVGADYSDVSVREASKRNAAAIAQGRCEVVQADVSRLDLPADSFDLVTAFETVYFWPEIERCFAHVYRVLRSGGRFLIVNESTGTDEAAVKYAQIIDGMRLYTPQRLEQLLAAAGFARIEHSRAEDMPWIAVLARKPER